ncbi:MerR family DNA-binding protein [Neptunicella sp.]
MKRCRSLNLSLAEIRKLVSLRKNTDNSCNSINLVMNTHIAQVKHRIY